jgi:G3E family GTPase
MVKVDIISGFLGAGKTTLIKKLLAEGLGNEKLVIIENEFGEVGIDGNLLKSSGIEVREINSGCICCTLVGDFGKAIEEAAAKYKPDRIIIEPSGVGKLSDVIKACGAPGLKEILAINMVIAVADALKYQIYISNFGEFFENQIRHAKTVVLSRTQKAGNKKLEAVADSIRKLNDRANIITTPWEDISGGLIVSVAEQDVTASLENELRGNGKLVLEHVHGKDCGCGCRSGHSHSHSADEVFDVWGAETPKQFDESELKRILGLLGNEKPYGMILRGKGVLQLDGDRWLQFDYTPGELELRETSADYTGRLCIIGRGLRKDELGRLFGIPA